MARGSEDEGRTAGGGTGADASSGHAGADTSLSEALASRDHTRLFAVLAIGLLVLTAAGVLLQPGSPASEDARPEPVRYRLNVNAAEASSLELLGGIGPTYAERIVRRRREHGPFRSLADLREVRGIGPKRSERIAPHIRFGPLKTAPSEQ